MHGNKHDWLVIDLYFSKEVMVQISMVDYLKAVIYSSPKEIIGMSLIPSYYWIFDVKGDYFKLE